MVATETPAALATSFILMAASPLSAGPAYNRLHSLFSALIIAYQPIFCKENCTNRQNPCNRFRGFGTFHKEIQLFLSPNRAKGGGQRLFWHGIMNLSDETGYIKGEEPRGVLSCLGPNMMSLMWFRRLLNNFEEVIHNV